MIPLVRVGLEMKKADRTSFYVQPDLQSKEKWTIFPLTMCESISQKIEIFRYFALIGLIPKTKEQQNYGYLIPHYHCQKLIRRVKNILIC